MLSTLASRSTPHMETELLPEPDLIFGSHGVNPNPKFGITEHGPYGVSDPEYALPEINIGLIGTGQTLQDCGAWLKRCESEIAGAEGKSRQYPRFPGFSAESPFKRRIRTQTGPELMLTAHEVSDVVHQASPEAQFEKAVALMDKKMSLLIELFNPKVIVCALPNEIAETCWSLGGDQLRRKRKGLSKSERILLRIVERDRKVGQGNLFPEAFEIEEEIKPIFRDFRRALKAMAMRHHCPIQIGLPETWRDSPKVQDPATRAWNFFVALYYKAGGVPWSLVELDDQTCFVGVSFYNVATEKLNYVYSSVAQVFDKSGRGVVVRGEKFDWDPTNWGRSPHLPKLAAENLLRKAIDKYSEFSGSIPQRVVLHKSSRFQAEELDGFRERFGDSSIQKISREILALTKLNWNSATFSCGFPMTLFFSREIGKILSEMRDEGDENIQPSYRFYI